MPSNLRLWTWNSLALGFVMLSAAAYIAFGLAGLSPERKSEASTEIKPATPPPDAIASHTPNPAAAPLSTSGRNPVSESPNSSPPVPLVDESSRERILTELQEAATTYDAAYLPKIQPYLSHPDAELRTAAVNAVITLGDSAGAPLLRAASSLIKDPREAVALLDAAEYMELPSGSMIQSGDTITANRGPSPYQVDGASQRFSPTPVRSAPKAKGPTKPPRPSPARPLQQ
jgi:hypothetical protein